jgi:hypothetical protein
MTTLKSINKAIEEGNEDLEKLRENFAKYFELQKRNRLDDLEDRREAKRKGGAPATVAAAVAAGSSSEDTKSGFKLPKLLTGLAAAIAAFLAARAAFGDPGTERPVKPGKINISNRRVPRVDSVLSRANNKLAKLRIANAKIAILAEQEKLDRRRKMQYNARRVITKPILSFPGALAEPETIRQRNLAQQRANQRAQIRADAARFRANSNKPLLSRQFTGFGQGINQTKSLAGLRPGVKPFGFGGFGGFNSNMQTVTSNSGRVYPVNSPQGQRVIKMTQNYQNSIKNQAGNKQMNQKFNSPKVSPFSKLSTSGNIGKAPVGGSALPPPSATQKLRTRLLGSTTAGVNAFNSTVKGVSGKIMTFTSATGKWAQDFKDLMAYRRGATLPKWVQLCTKMAGWMARRVIGAYIAYQWFYVMTDPNTSKQDKLVSSAGLLAAFGGAVIGTAIGAFIGTLAIPIPLVGTILGGTLGGYLAAKKGQEIGEFIAREIMGIKQPEPVLADMTEFKAMVDAQTSRFDSINADRDRMVRNPLPSGVRPTGPGGIAIGGAGGDAMSVGAGFGGFTPGGITGTGFSGFGSMRGENNTNISKGRTGAHFTNLAVTPTGDRLNQIDHINSQNNSFMANAMRGFSSAGRDGGGFFNQSNNANDNSTTHNHNYGNNQIRTIEGGGGQNVITDKMMFF